MLASTALVAIVHLRDRYQTDHESGAWMGLAKYLHAGVLYPPLFSHGRFGGTRYMPLKTAFDAAASWVTGEYLTSGKVVGLLTVVALLAVVGWSLRKSGCPTAVALGLSAAAIATGNGFFAATSNYGDALPVALQVAALTLVSTGTGRRMLVIAAALCSLALFSKLSAVWAPAAIVLWLALRHRARLAGLFVATYVGISLFLAAATDLASRDRFRLNFEELARSGSTGRQGLLHVAPHRFIQEIDQSALPLTLLLVLAVGAYTVAVRYKRHTIHELALPLAALVLFVVLSDVGAAENHLLDLDVLTAMMIGSVWPVLPQADARGRVELVTAAAISVALVGGYVRNVAEPAWSAAKQLAGAHVTSYPRNPLAGVVSRRDTLLSQDPSIPVALRETPVILDPFMLLRIDRDHPSWGATLVQRLDEHRFSKVVMIGRPSPNELWWKTHHLGPRIAAAIFRNYRPGPVVNGYTVYVPREAAG